MKCDECKHEFIDEDEEVIVSMGNAGQPLFFCSVICKDNYRTNEIGNLDDEN